VVKKPCLTVLALLLYGAVAGAASSAQHAGAVKSEIDSYAVWRAAAARTLAARGDASSLATAAALTFLGPASRPKTETGKAAASALEFAIKASVRAPNNPAISWLRLRLCMNSPGCDIREAATTMRWLAADNAAAWLPTLNVAQRDKDTMEVDRVLASMAEGSHFDVYLNPSAALMFGALKRARGQLAPRYLPSDAARLTEAVGIATAAVVPSFSPLINACRDPAADAERRETCVKLSRTMQHADAVMAQLVGFALDRRLNPGDAKEMRTVAERRRVLEWRVATANEADAAVLPSLKNSLARARAAKMRKLAREEDVSIAILKEHKLPLEPPS
jgi:hypothetical protein